MTAARVFAVLAGLALLVATSAAARPFPDVLPLPTGFQPEGIDIRGQSFYVGSIPTGAVYRGDLRTGTGSVLVPTQAGRAAIGLDVDSRGRIFVAGGPTGQAYVYDARTGAPLASYQLAAGEATFVNDVIVTKDAAWFTESQQAVLYRVPIRRNGRLGAQDDVETVPLTGDFELAAGFNVNGIDATRGGKTLVVVQSNLGRLYTVEPTTGEADLVELSGGDVVFGDGILLDGKTLYVVQNQLNRVAVVRLTRSLGSGTIVEHLTDPALDVPTTIAEFGRSLYAVNARFGTPNPGSAAYSVTRLEK
jgi:outer membrane protein assembly factor BamB